MTNAMPMCRSCGDRGSVVPNGCVTPRECGDCPRCVVCRVECAAHSDTQRAECADEWARWGHEHCPTQWGALLIPYERGEGWTVALRCGSCGVVRAAPGRDCPLCSRPEPEPNYGAPNAYELAERQAAARRIK